MGYVIGGKYYETHIHDWSYGNYTAIGGEKKKKRNCGLCPVVQYALGSGAFVSNDDAGFEEKQFVQEQSKVQYLWREGETMMSETEIRAEIKRFYEGAKHLLEQTPKDVQINAYVALEQCSCCSYLEALYMVLGEKRPRMKCDDFEHKNQ